jgi:hypothetical protein
MEKFKPTRQTVGSSLADLFDSDFSYGAAIMCSVKNA